jgi:hypothetical protein
MQQEGINLDQEILAAETRSIEELAAEERANDRQKFAYQRSREFRKAEHKNLKDKLDLLENDHDAVSTERHQGTAQNASAEATAKRLRTTRENLYTWSSRARTCKACDYAWRPF